MRKTPTLTSFFNEEVPRRLKNLFALAIFLSLGFAAVGQCPNVMIPGTAGDDGATACYGTAGAVAGAGTEPIFEPLPNCPGSPLIFYAVYPCGTYAGTPTVTNGSWLSLVADVSSISAGAADGWSNIPNTSGEACLEFVPVVLCDNFIPDAACGGDLPADPFSVTQIFFPGVPQGSVNVGAGTCQADFTADFALTISGTASYTVNTNGDATVSSDDGAGNVVVTLTDPDYDDDGNAATGAVQVLDANGCVINTTTLPSFNATDCGYVPCTTLSGGTPGPADGMTACYATEDAIDALPTGSVAAGDIGACPGDATVRYAAFTCNYAGQDVTYSDPDYLFDLTEAQASSIISNASGMDPFGAGVTCLVVVPYYRCSFGLIPSCSPTDAAAATTVNFPGVAPAGVTVQNGVCQPDFTVDFEVRVVGTPTYTLELAGDTNIKSDDNAGTIIVTLTDPDYDDDGVAASGQIKVRDEDGCVINTTNLPSFNATSCGYIPVELIYFEARQIGDQKVMLEWQTATELNNAGFDVEWSVDGDRWEVLEFIEGAGTTSEVQTYQVIHDFPVGGLNYYRLRQVDYDGAYEYTGIEIVEITDENEVSNDLDFIVFPNPSLFGQNKIIKLYSQEDRVVSCKLISLNGSILLDWEEQVYQGMNHFIMDKELPQSGMYTLMIQTGSRVKAVRMIVNKE